MPTSTTQLTKRHLEAVGWTVGLVERWIPGGRNFNRRVDLYGFADQLAIHPDRPITAVQSTTATNRAAHVTTITNEPRAAKWILAGGAILLICWAKRPLKPGAKAMRWRPDLTYITLDDMQPDAIESAAERAEHAIQRDNGAD